MGKIAIHVEGLGKAYHIGDQVRSGSLRDHIAALGRIPVDAVKAWWGGRPAGEPDRIIWALRDVTFDVKQGEVLGIIGRNGAGKSTLLKILSRITKPTVGHAVVDGRIGSLLEVGTGFHSELTGRENIYLNGAILGMKYAEIEKKFDAIVAFADIDTYLDTPVKYYSTGMYLRLAFSVAAHFDPEILIVDEVLSVGDIAFQKRCMAKLHDVVKQGNTVILVSHNMAAVEAFCQRGILIDGGRVVAEGSAKEIVHRYLASNTPTPSRWSNLTMHQGRRVGSQPMMQSVALEFRDSNGTVVDHMSLGGNLALKVTYESDVPIQRPVLGYEIKNEFGVYILGLNNRYTASYPTHVPAGQGTITCHLDKCPLAIGLYSVDLWFGDDLRDYDVVENAISFEVVPADIFGTGVVPGAELGAVVWPPRWEFNVNKRHETNDG